MSASDSSNTSVLLAVGASSPAPSHAVSLAGSRTVSLRGRISADDLSAAVSAATSLGVSATLQLSGSISKVVSVLGALKGRLGDASVMLSLRGNVK